MKSNYNYPFCARTGIRMDLRAQEVQLGEMAPPHVACANKTPCHRGNSALQAHQVSLIAKSICEWKVRANGYNKLCQPKCSF